MRDIASLIERLEKATGPDRELDGAIAMLIEGLPEWKCGPTVFGEYEGKNGGVFTAPRYTSSINAALTLLPPGFWWRGGTCSVSSEVTVCPDHNDPEHRERLLCDYPPTNPVWDEGIEVELRPGSDHAFCRAFAAACLRARAQSEPEKQS